VFLTVILQLSARVICLHAIYQPNMYLELKRTL